MIQETADLPHSMLSSAGSIDPVAFYAYVIANSTIALAIIVALVATIIVFQAARKMRGGAFGLVLSYFSAGMFCVVVGFILTIMPPVQPLGISFPLVDVAFMVGYILMLLGARTLMDIVTPRNH